MKLITRYLAAVVCLVAATAVLTPSQAFGSSSAVSVHIINSKPVQAATDPLEATFGYQLVSHGGALPKGVFDLYAPSAPGGQTRLVCSRPATPTGHCRVHFANVGTFRVTTRYATSHYAVTVVESVVLVPYPAQALIEQQTVPPSTGCQTSPTNTWTSCHLLYARVTSGNNVVVPNAGALAFTLYVDGDVPVATFTTKVYGQVSCLITFTAMPTMTTSKSDDCLGGGTVARNGLGFVGYGGTFTQPGYASTLTTVLN